MNHHLDKLIQVSTYEDVGVYYGVQAFGVQNFNKAAMQNSKHVLVRNKKGNVCSCT